MRFFKIIYRSDLNDSIKMMNVHVHKHAEQAVDELFAYGLEALGKRYTHSHWEHVFVIDLLLDPVHQ